MIDTYVPPPVETKDDIQKKIEIEAQNLMYFEYMDKDQAFKEARKYVENKYKDVVLKLKQAGEYK
jgi:hypothetical protein